METKINKTISTSLTKAHFNSSKEAFGEKGAIEVMLFADMLSKMSSTELRELYPRKNQKEMNDAKD